MGSCDRHPDRKLFHPVIRDQIVTVASKKLNAYQGKLYAKYNDCFRSEWRIIVAEM
jgi:hypothetical protein